MEIYYYEQLISGLGLLVLILCYHLDLEFHDDSDAHFNKSINELLGGIVEDSGSENSTLNLNSTLNNSAGESVLHPHTGGKQPKKKYLQVKGDFHISTISSPAHGRSPGFSKSATSSPIMLKSTASKSSHTVTSNYTKMPLSPVTSPIARSASTSKPSSQQSKSLLVNNKNHNINFHNLEWDP